MTLPINKRQSMRVVKTTYFVEIYPEKLHEFLVDRMDELVDKDLLQDAKFPLNPCSLTCTMTVNGYLEVAWDVINEL